MSQRTSTSKQNYQGKSKYFDSVSLLKAGNNIIIDNVWETDFMGLKQLYMLKIIDQRMEINILKIHRFKNIEKKLGKRE